MKKGKLLLVIVVLLCNTAYGLAPLGPPTTDLAKGQYRIGLDYAYSEADLEESILGATYTLKDVESSMVMANLGYGLVDNCQVFLRLGAADVELEDFYDSGYKFAYGLGTKVNLAQNEQFSWGTIFQINWSDTEDSILGVNIEADWYEIQIAFGSTYKYQEGWLIYGGPFLHFVEGDIDYKGLGSTDLEEESKFGGYIGTQIDLAGNSSFFVEYQFTGDAYAVGTGISWKF
ncbi:MAG: hypothetical protein ACYSSI_00185 [Planctomycetota bacterium]|jgi:hypothetical protein